MHAHLHGVRARLEHRDDALVADLAPQAVDRGRRSRSGDARSRRTRATPCTSPRSSMRRFTPLNVRQRGDGLRHGHAGVARGTDGGERILRVVRADQRPVHRARRLAALEHLELARSRRPSAGRARPQRIRCPASAREAFARRPAAHRERLLRDSRRLRSTRCGRCPARCAPGDGTGAGSRRDPRRCRRDRIRGC